MANFVVPNTPDAAHIDLAEPDAGDFKALGYRATGVLSGGVIDALGTPGMAVAVGATTVIINGVPYSFGSTNPTIQAAGGNPRFDIVGWDSTGAKVVTGTSGTNPVFPTYDPSTFCLGAIVYIAAGAVSITSQYVISKGPTMEPTFRRTYALPDDIMLRGSVGSDHFTITAGGKHTWGSSILAKISDAVMEWTTNLKIKAADSAQSVLTLTGRSTSPETHAVLDVRNHLGQQVAYIDGDGRFAGLNFQRGIGSPEGGRIGYKGDMYINAGANDGNFMYIKSTNGGTTGWLAHRAFDPTIGAIPPGSVVAWMGPAGAGAPAGYIEPIGQTNLSTATYPNLFTVTQYRFGGGGGSFGLPDLRGRSLFGEGGPDSFTVGANWGTSGSVALTINELPAHDHQLIDWGHSHEQAGPYWYYKPSAFHNNKHPFPSTSLTLEHLYVDWNTQRNGFANLTVLPKGSNQAFSILPPMHIVKWLVKT